MNLILDDNLCLRCAECCREKFLVNNQVIAADFYCPALNTKTKLCTVYTTRHETMRTLGSQCLSLLEIWTNHNFALPSSCAYISAWNAGQTWTYNKNKVHLIPRLQYWKRKAKNWILKWRLK